MDIKKLAQAAQAWNNNQDLLIAKAIQDSEKELVQLNRNQMLKSKDAKDTTIKPKYSAKYADFKGFDNPNLKLSGDFQKDMFLEVDTKHFFLESFDFKSPFLTGRYSDDIFGIAPSSLLAARLVTNSNYLRRYINKVWNI